MADIEVKVKAVWDESDSKKSAKTFAQSIQSSLQKGLSRVGVGGGEKSEGKGGKGGTALAAGIGGAVGGAIGSILGGPIAMIAEALLDFPIVTSIMKLLKLILTILLLPLIPILKPVLILLMNFIKLFLPVINVIMGALTKLMSGDIFGFLKDAFINLPIAFGNFINNMAKFLAAGLGTWLSNIWKGIVNMGVAIGGFFKWLWGVITSFFSALFKGLGDILTKVWTGMVLFFTAIGIKLTEVWTNIVKGIGAFFTQTWVKLKDFASSIVSGIVSPITTVLTGLKSALNVGKNIVSSVGNFLTGKKSKASGGVISEEGQYYLHKGERVTSATESNKGNSGGSNPVNINISIDKPSVRSDKDIKDLVAQISREMQKGVKRYVSYQ